MRFHLSLATLLALACAVSGQTQTRTADGVVLINQATVAASAVNRSTGGFPYTITQPGSYRLSGNLTVPATVNGIVIAANNVSFDLNGFCISCSGDCTGWGITDNATAQSGTTIRNGMVSGFADGIYFGASTATFIRNVTVQSNTNIGIQVFSSSTIKDCIAANNTSAGIWAGGSGNTLTGNIATGGSNGFIVGEGSTATGNTANAYSSFGFYVVCPSNLIGNTATGGGVPEIELGVGCTKTNNLGF